MVITHSSFRPQQPAKHQNFIIVYLRTGLWQCFMEKHKQSKMKVKQLTRLCKKLLFTQAK